MVHQPEDLPPTERSREVVSRRLLERDFCAKVEKSDGWWEALGALSNYVERPLDQLEGFARDLCLCCLGEADRVAAGGGQLAAARAEVDRLKDKLLKCNLSTMKQLEAIRTRNHADAELGDDLITFHEPLLYLEQDAKELVLTIVNEKVRLLDNGTAPPSLVQALVNKASEGGRVCQGPQAASELAEELEDARLLLQEARKRAERAEDEAEEARRAQANAEQREREMEREVEVAKEQALVAETKLAEARQALAKLQEQYQELEKVSAEQREQIAQQQAELAQQKEELAAKQAELERQSQELERQREELARIGEELKREREANEVMRAELKREREANATLRGRVQQLEGELQLLQGRYQALEKEANEMREELARRNNTVTHSTQTTLTGTKIDEHAEERKRLKVMLEELQMKLKDLLDKCRRKGVGDSVSQIAQDLGLEEVLKEKTVFQRLYDDAVNRCQRLEKLREKVQRERRDLFPQAGVPHSMAAGDARDDSPEVSVLDSIAESKLPGLQGLVREKEKEKERERHFVNFQMPGVPSSPVPERERHVVNFQLPGVPTSPIPEGAPAPAWALRRNQLAPPERSEARSNLLPPAELMSSPQQGGFMSPPNTSSPRRQMRNTNSLPSLARTQTHLPVVLVGRGDRGGGRGPRQLF